VKTTFKILLFFIGPATLALTWWLIEYYLPQLSPKLQEEINYGILGGFIGFHGGAIILMTLIISWHNAQDLFNQYFSHRKQFKS
jgi:hypothetical protein